MKAILSSLLIIFSLPGILVSQEKLEVKGAVIIGESEDSNPQPGTIRWTGADFEGWNGSRWMSLTNAFTPQFTGLDSVILLDSIYSFTVPDGFDFYIVRIQSEGGLITVDEATFPGFGSHLDHRLSMIVGAGMTITSAEYLTIYGFLHESQDNFFAKNLSIGDYVVPMDKTLYITTYYFNNNVEINEVTLFPPAVVFPGQTISGEGSFIGYLR